MTTEKAPNPFKKYLLLITVPLGIVLVDQLSKWWIKSILDLGGSFPPGWPVRFTYVQNTGIAFGIKANPVFLVIVTSAVVVALLVFLLRYYQFQPGLVRVALSSILGGAMGNLIDRVNQGYVVDFIDLQVWPVFNIADSSVVVGVGLLMFFLIFRHETRPPVQNG